MVNAVTVKEDATYYKVPFHLVKDGNSTVTLPFIYKEGRSDVGELGMQLVIYLLGLHCLLL